MAQYRWLFPLLSGKLSSKTLINTSTEVANISADAYFGIRPRFTATMAATAFNKITVTLNLLDLGGVAGVTGYLEYGTTSSFGSKSDDIVFNAAGTYEFDVTVSSKTTYYTRVAIEVTSESDKDYSDVAVVTTPYEMPTAAAYAPTYLSTNGFRANGAITDAGDYSNKIGLKWGTTSACSDGSYQWTTSYGYPTSKEYAFSGYEPYTYHYYQFYATCTGGTAYSNVVAVRTLPNDAVVTTNSVHDITTTEAAVSCNLTNIGSFAAEGIKVGIQYDTASDFSSCTTEQIDVLNATGIFVGSITGLQPGTTYYVRAYAQNQDGVYTYYGSSVSFTTATEGGLNAVLTITSHSADRLSDETGMTTCAVEFTTDIAIGSWEARATYESQTPGPGVGWVVGSGSSLGAGATGTFDVTYDELTYGDRTYTISVYQLS